MKKTVIRRLFISSLIAIGAGLALLLAAAATGVATSSFVMNGPDVAGIRATPLAWSLVGIASLAILVMAAAGVTQLIAWIGALLNTAKLEDKTWFIVLLLLGLASFGFVAMGVYLIAGPDGTAPVPQRPLVPVRPVATNAL
jgi:hypothetical protein